MPIVFVHGVNVRDDSGWAGVETYLRRYVAPVLRPDDPAAVPLLFAKWYPLGVQFAWGGASRPRTRLLGMGGAAAPGAVEQAVAAAESAALVDAAPAPAPAPSGGLVAFGGAGGSAAGAGRLHDLDDDALAEVLLAAALGARGQTAGARPTGTAFDGAAPVVDAEFARVAIAADDAAHDPAVRAALAAAPDGAAEADVLQRAVEERLRRPAVGALVGQGALPAWAQRLGDRVREAVARVDRAPGYVLSAAVLEARGPLNDLVTRFFGDVFVYLRQQGERRAIADTVAASLREARDAAPGEPLVVLSHSMGGQIVYDLVTHDLARDPATADIRVDFWAAAASQVGLFEEMKLFRFRDDQYRTGHPVPFPDRARLGGWWNVWDPNDVLSFTVRGIIDGFEARGARPGAADEAYEGGLSLVSAHGGYLVRPSFYRRLATKLEAARDADWYRP